MDVFKDTIIKLEEKPKMDNQINFFTVQDIMDEQEKGIPIDPNKTYDPLHFWEDFGDKYYKSFTKMQDVQKNLAWIVHKLGTLKIDTLLDVGCSFCRLEPFIIDAKSAKEVTGVDSSSKQLECANEYLKDYPQKDKIKTVNASVKHLPFENESFDCVITHELLMHLHPIKVWLAIKEMARVSKKYLLFVERFVYVGEHPQPHIWTHDYTKLINESALTIMESKLIGNGQIGIIMRKNR